MGHQRVVSRRIAPKKGIRAALFILLMCWAVSSVDRMSEVIEPSKREDTYSDFSRGVVAVDESPLIKSPFVFDIIVLTMDRPESLTRLLHSIEATDYEKDTVRLVVRIDVRKGNTVHAPTKELAESFHFSHGPSEIFVADSNQGLRAAWLNAWKPIGSSQNAIIIEDDIALSPVWYTFVKRSWALYGSDPTIAGISLNRQSFIPHKKAPSRNREIVNGHQPFLYKLVGSQGFSPSSVLWSEFLHFVGDIPDLNAFPAHVPDLITSDWYMSLDKEAMWTQLFIFFCEQRGLYTLYINLPQKETLAAHFREKGEHSAATQGRDFELASTLSGIYFPETINRYDWDGKLVT
jgi:hypothetical protein